jgi:hypothetical protein
LEENEKRLRAGNTDLLLLDSSVGQIIFCAMPKELKCVKDRVINFF